MDYPSSSSTPSSVHSPPSDYPQSVENSSQEPYSAGPSTNSSPRSPQPPFFSLFPPTNYYSSSPSPSRSPSFSPSRSPSPFPSTSPSLSQSGRPTIGDFGRRQERARPPLPDYADLFSMVRSARCAKYYLAWNACMDEAIRTEQDYMLKCSRFSRAFRDCVRHF